MAISLAIASSNVVFFGVFRWRFWVAKVLFFRIVGYHEVDPRLSE